MMKIEILGTGCPKCKTLASNAELAAKELGVEYELVKITEISDIINYGVMMTPALVINSTVKSSGKLLSVDEITELLKS